MQVTDEGKKYYLELLRIYSNAPEQDSITKSLIVYIAYAVLDYKGKEDISINVPVSAVINSKIVPANDRHKLISESVNDLMSGPLKVESNCNSKQFASFVMISYFAYKPGNSHFEVKIPLTTFSDWTSHVDVIPDYESIFKTHGKRQTTNTLKTTLDNCGGSR